MARTISHSERLYRTAHEKWFQVQYPSAYADGHYLIPKFPKVETANGLTQFCINYLTWSGYYANRITSSGRYLPAQKKFIPSQTKKGTADIHAIVNGKHLSIEIKVGKDRPSPAQLSEQAKIRGVGGIYEFVSCPEDLFNILSTIT